MAVNSFTIYEEYFELITLLDEKKQAELLLAICNYMFKDEEPNLNQNQMKIFTNLKRPLDKSKNKSRNKIKSNQNQNEIKSKSNENQNETKTKTHQDVVVDVNVYVNVNKILEFIESNFNRTISGYELEQIESLVKEHGHDIVLYAFQKTLDAGKKSLNYTKGILSNWKEDNLKTLEQIKNNETRKPKKEDDWEDDYWHE